MRSRVLTLILPLMPQSTTIGPSSKADDRERHRPSARQLRRTASLPTLRAFERHEYELYLAVEDIDHSRTKIKSPQTNGICERFHKTVLNEFYRVAFRKKV